MKYFNILLWIALWGVSLNSAHAATAIYRSVGNNASPVDSGGANPMTIAAGVATFTSALSNSVGVGDVIQYDSDGNGTIDAYAIIQTRASSQVYTVLRADGLTNPTAVVGDSDWGIYRAYQHLNDLDQGIENSSLSGAISNFDIWTLGRDAVANNEIWHIACYGDATETQSQILGNYGGWVLDATRYLHIYTPTSTAEVGVTQRHSGSWDATKFHIRVSTAGIGVDEATLKFAGLFKVHAEGLQVFRNNGTLTGDVVFFENTNNTPGVEFKFNNNIVKSSLGGGGDIIGLTITDNEAGTFDIYNNLIYNVNSRGISENSYKMGGIGGITTLANNTVVNAPIGIFVVGSANDGRVVLARNNLVQGATIWGFDGSNSAPAFGGNFSAASSQNISNFADAVVGTGFVASATVTFVNAAGEDYHLSPLDAVAKGTGLDPGSFTDDIEGYTRGTTWDVGADQADPVPKAPTAVSVF